MDLVEGAVPTVRGMTSGNPSSRVPQYYPDHESDDDSVNTHRQRQNMRASFLGNSAGPGNSESHSDLFSLNHARSGGGGGGEGEGEGGSGRGVGDKTEQDEGHGGENSGETPGPGGIPAAGAAVDGGGREDGAAAERSQPAGPSPASAGSKDPHAGWLRDLLGAKFFCGCSDHPLHKKNECTFFCLECAGGSLCQHCLPDHGGHTQLQIRRYVYHDVVRLQDIHKYIETSGVQTYIINSARVMFLNQRPQSRPVKGIPGDTCETCDRCLREGFRFCCVACKVESTDAKGGSLVLEPRPGRGVKASDSDASDSDVTVDVHTTKKRPVDLGISMDMQPAKIKRVSTATSSLSHLAWNPPTPRASPPRGVPGAALGGCATPGSARRKGTPARAPMW